MSIEEKQFNKRDVIRICENRGWRPLHIQQFLNLYDNMAYGYTLSMVDQYEFSVNGPVIGCLHPDLAKDFLDE